MRFCKNIVTIAVASLLLQSVFVPAGSAGHKPHIRIIATGGTIANSPDGRMGVDTVLEQVPGIAEFADIEIRDYVRIGSSEITIQNWKLPTSLIWCSTPRCRSSLSVRSGSGPRSARTALATFTTPCVLRHTRKQADTA
jgi:hypothetical protein